MKTPEEFVKKFKTKRVCNHSQSNRCFNFTTICGMKFCIRQDSMSSSQCATMAFASNSVSKKRKWKQPTNMPKIKTKVTNANKSCQEASKEDAGIPRAKQAGANPILIPLRGLRSVRDGSFSITITPNFEASSADKGSLEVVIPKILDHATSKRFFIEEINSCLTKPWIDFVVEYLTTIAENWSTVRQVKRWVENCRSIEFSAALQLLWHRAGAENRFWRIAKSKVKPNPKYWEGSSGSGLFCTRAGKHRIEFGMLPESHWVEKTPTNGSLQQSYAIGPELCEPDTAGKKVLRYFVPSRSSLASGLISCGFKVNCEDERYGNPTHSLVFESGSLYLKPLRKAEVGMEFTYDYRYYLGVRTSIDT